MSEESKLGADGLEAERITVVSITGIIQAVAATDYDSLKAERDRLQKELADLHSARNAPAERVEVVGYAGLNQLELHRLLPKYPGMKIKKQPNERYTEPLMTVAQHQRIVAAISPAGGGVAMPQQLTSVVKFLLGEGEIDGYGFGEQPPHHPHFWWLRHLREAIDALAKPQANSQEVSK